MPRIIILVLILLSISYRGLGQAFEINDLRTLSDQYSYERSRIISIYGMDHAEVEGTPYLNEAFLTGEVHLNDSIRFVDIPLRYNIYSNRMEFINEKGQILELDIEKDGFVFYFADKVFLMKDYVYNGLDNRGVLELIADGKIQLYRKYDVDFMPATQPKGFQEAKPNRFVRQREKYLFAFEGQNPTNFRNRRELITALQHFDPEIEEYIKSNRLKVNSEKGLKQIIERVNN